MTWFHDGKDDFFKSEDFCHIWVDQSTKGFYVMGEWRHNSEEVCISNPFETKDKAILWIKEMLGLCFVFRNPKGEVFYGNP